MNLNPAVKVIDSTKLQDYMTCPRLFMFRHVFGWKKKEQSVDLVFGIAWHEAMAYLTQVGYSVEAYKEAYRIFLEVYRKEFPDASMDVELRAPKVPMNAEYGLCSYIAYYSDDRFEILHTEIAGSVEIAANRKLHFKIDSIIRETDGRIAVLERKTAGVGKVKTRAWQDQWALSIQVGTYSHVLHMLYPPEQVHGVIVDGFSVMNIKKDGSLTPPKDMGDIFARLQIAMPMPRMEAWLDTANFWVAGIEYDLDALETASESDSVLDCFHMNTTNCTKYWGCPFRDVCVTRQNPLSMKETPLFGDSDWAIEFWDPRSEEQKAKEVLNI